MASQIVYQLSFMFLKMNQSFFVKEMKKNRNKLPAATVKDDRSNIAFLIDKMYPPYDHKEAFQKYEKVLGHDPCMKFIMSLSKVGSNKPLPSKFIPEVQSKQLRTGPKARHPCHFISGKIFSKNAPNWM
jgi:hypothetical protein